MDNMKNWMDVCGVSSHSTRALAHDRARRPQSYMDLEVRGIPKHSNSQEGSWDLVGSLATFILRYLVLGGLRSSKGVESRVYCRVGFASPISVRASYISIVYLSSCYDSCEGCGAVMPTVMVVRGFDINTTATEFHFEHLRFQGVPRKVVVLASDSVWARLLMFVILNLLVLGLMLLQLGPCSLLLSIIVPMVKFSRGGFEFGKGRHGRSPRFLCHASHYRGCYFVETWATGLECAL
ncbi:hypothetical protein H5410_060694, partial [Solanum commersonii]